MRRVSPRFLRVQLDFVAFGVDDNFHIRSVGVRQKCFKRFLQYAYKNINRKHQRTSQAINVRNAAPMLVF